MDHIRIISGTTFCRTNSAGKHSLDSKASVLLVSVAVFMLPHYVLCTVAADLQLL